MFDSVLLAAAVIAGDVLVVANEALQGRLEDRIARLLLETTHLRQIRRHILAGSLLVHGISSCLAIAILHSVLQLVGVGLVRLAQYR